MDTHRSENKKYNWYTKIHTHPGLKIENITGIQRYGHPGLKIKNITGIQRYKHTQV